MPREGLFAFILALHLAFDMATCSMSFGSDQGMELALMLVDAST